MIAYGDIYTQNILHFSGFTIDCRNAADTPVYLFGFSTTEVYLNNTSIVNGDFPASCIISAGVNKIDFTDLTVKNTSMSGLNLISIEYASQISFTNFNFDQFRASGGLSNSVIYLNVLPFSITTMTGWSIVNADIGEYNMLDLNPILTGSMFGSNLSFANVTLGTEAMLLRASTVNSFQITDSKFTDIARVDDSDETNSMIYIETIGLLEAGTYLIENITVESSAITFFKMNNIDSSSSLSAKLEIRSLTFSNSYSRYSLDIISIENLETESSFEIEISDVEASNITFDSTGNLFNFRHQTAIPLVLKDCYFHDLHGVNIYLEASNLLNHELFTNVKMMNITVDKVSSAIKSFIINNEGGYLEIHNSSFTNMDNVERGAVITGGYQNSQTLIYNSTFTNNTSIYGGVANVLSGSVIKFYNCNLTSNFAIQSGVIQASDDGYFEFYDSAITDNHAYTVPISEIYISSPLSIISNTIISSNLVLSKDYISAQVAKCTGMCYLSDAYKAYLLSNPQFFSQKSINYGFQCVSGTLKIESESTITDQPYFVSAYLSEVELKDVLINDIYSNSQIITATSSNLAMRNVAAINLTTSGSGLFLATYFESIASITWLSYSSSTMKLLRWLASSMNLIVIAKDITLSDYLIEFSDSYDINIENTSISRITTTASAVILASKSTLSSIENLKLSNLNSVALDIQFSNIDSITTVTIDKADKGIIIYESHISSLQNATVTNWGTETELYGGALLLEDSNVSIADSLFKSNQAHSGGAIAIICSSYEAWDTAISQSKFASNNATEQGGAVYYDFKRPQLSSNIFINNLAQYGPNIASYAVRIVLKTQMDHQIKLTNIGSGIKYSEQITLALADYDSQIMVLSNTTKIKLSPVTVGSSLIGTDSAKVTDGIAVFNDIGFVYEPGAQQIMFNASNSEIDRSKTSKLNLATNGSIEVSFRWCQPGETIDSDTRCRKCSAGSYSLNWNSTKWENCMDNAVCLGGTEIEVYPEYWREDRNSTTIVHWPRPDSCKGGYHPENKHPVECETGYTSYLCTKCEIIGGTKYQRVSAYQCNKCPDPVMNGIRVVGVMLAAFAFLMMLIVIMIRKKKENQTSILIRIMTNYIQLLATAMAFGLSFPTSLTSLFGPIDTVGSTSDTFLSFDCFIEDTDLKAFTPSNEIFKVFLTFFCPFLLIGLCGFIWLIMLFISKKRFGNLKRHTIISIICIIFLLHPAITKATLSLFECIEISEEASRMRLYMEYECYSQKHVLWITIVGLPSVILWIIGAPCVALLILYKQRDHLETGTVKKYFLILYQGLTRRAFYWEFVNTIRKVLILSIYTILSFISVFYRVLLSILMLIFVLRIQRKLRPYKEDINNELEMKAIIVGALALYFGILFEEDNGDRPGFNTTAFIVLVLFNIMFFIQWLYYFLVSFNFKNDKAIMFLKLYAFLICKKYNERNLSFQPELSKKSISKQPSVEKPIKHKKKKKIVKKHLHKRMVRGKIANQNKFESKVDGLNFVELSRFHSKGFKTSDRALLDSSLSINRVDGLMEESKGSKEAILELSHLKEFELKAPHRPRASPSPISRPSASSLSNPPSYP